MRSDAHDPADLGALLPIPGVGTRQQWHAAGATRSMFSDGRLRQIIRGLYCLPSNEPTARDLLELLRPAIPAHAVVSGWAAALLHGVRDAGPSMHSRIPEPVQLCLPRSEHLLATGCTTLRCDLDEDELSTIDGFVVSTIARTAYDMVRFSASDEQALSLVDCFTYELNPAPLQPSELSSTVLAHPKSRGNPRVRRAVALCSSRARSPMESVLRFLLVTGLGLDPSLLLVNPTLIIDGIHFEYDLVDLSSGLFLEYDGPHHSSALQRSRDHRKERIVAAEGLALSRLTVVDFSRKRTTLLADLAQRRKLIRDAGGSSRVGRLVANGVITQRPMRSYPQPAPPAVANVQLSGQ